MTPASRESSRWCRRRPRRCTRSGSRRSASPASVPRAGPAVVGGTKNPDRDAIVALAPGSRRRERRGEPGRGRRRARCRRARVALDVAPVGGGRRVRGAGAGRSASTSPCRRRSVQESGTTGSRRCSRPHWWDAFVAVWRRPWMSLASDTYGASLLDLLGVGNLFADSLDRYPEVTLAEVAARAPSVVLLPDEPYAFTEKHARRDPRRDRPGARAPGRRPRPLLVGLSARPRPRPASAPPSERASSVGDARGAERAQFGADAVRGVVERVGRRRRGRRARTTARAAG